jgi:hypothetical protein
MLLLSHVVQCNAIAYTETDRKRYSTYVVIIGMTHLETTVPLDGIRSGT